MENDIRFKEKKVFMSSKLRRQRARHFNRLLLFTVALVFALVLLPSECLEVCAAKANNIANGESRFTTLDGARIHYVNYGKGSEALVLIHGWTMNLDSWRDQVSDFAKRNRVIVIELPGHGQSDKPQITYSMDLLRARLMQSCAMLR